LGAVLVSAKSRGAPGPIAIEKGSFFKAYPPFKGGDNTSRAVIVPGTTIGSGGKIPPTPP